MPIKFRLNIMNDGVDHINVYSKGKTKLGRFLSNFSKFPIRTFDGNFMSVEGYWYWLNCTHLDKDVLRDLHGYQAKKIGRELGTTDWNEDIHFKRKICRAIKFKILNAPFYMKEEFLKSELPFRHYYVYGDRVIEATKCDWILDFLEKLRIKLKGS